MSAVRWINGLSWRWCLNHSLTWSYEDLQLCTVFVCVYIKPFPGIGWWSNQSGFDISYLWTLASSVLLVYIVIMVFWPQIVHHNAVLAQAQASWWWWWCQKLQSSARKKCSYIVHVKIEMYPQKCSFFKRWQLVSCCFLLVSASIVMKYSTNIPQRKRFWGGPECSLSYCSSEMMRQRRKHYAWRLLQDQYSEGRWVLRGSGLKVGDNPP